ncbi:TetR/AcrR family transcriptional regulator [Sulfitobacter sp. 1A12157]|uniref:TetR/AcrR family transcriptional regulator n=1 Tax=Sulfitobacter sp. 1A12157 TaxID=3368594 RepID=UPI0037451CAB
MTRPSITKKSRDPLAAPNRRKPKQKRSVTTVKQILEAAIKLLEIGGFEAITMQAIADEAGVNIATAYSYFPNKHQLLARLAEDQINARLDVLARMLADVAAAPDWVSAFGATLHDLFDMRRRQRGSVALRRALHASPDLWAIDQDGNRKAAILVGDVLRQRSSPGLHSSTDIRGRIIAECVTASLDLAQSCPEDKAAHYIEELVVLMQRYLQEPPSNMA